MAVAERTCTLGENDAVAREGGEKVLLLRLAGQGMMSLVFVSQSPIMNLRAAKDNEGGKATRAPFHGMWSLVLPVS
jgi:hypothetical protein